MEDIEDSIELLLRREFGSSFLLLALYSGELLGYSFETWSQFNLRIEEWCALLNTSRRSVAAEWTSIWQFRTSLLPSQEQRAAMSRALLIWNESLQKQRADCDRQPPGEVDLRGCDQELCTLPHLNVAPDHEAGAL